MGSLCSGKKSRTCYSDSDYLEETELRKFEEEIGLNKKSLNSVLARISIEKDTIHIPGFNEYIRTNFTEQLVQVLSSDYFIKEVNGEKYYDARKVNLLLFLLSRDSSVDNGRLKYHDKTNFIFANIKTRQDQPMSDPIMKGEDNFTNLLNDIYDICCSVLVDAYQKQKNVDREGQLKKLADERKAVVTLIENSFMDNKDKNKTGSLSFDQMNKKFEDRYFVTPGWFREFAWYYVVTCKAHMEKKESGNAGNENGSENKSDLKEPILPAENEGEEGENKA